MTVHGRLLSIALQHICTVHRISPKGSERPDPTLNRHRGEIGRVSALGDVTDNFACFFETYMGKVLQGENARQNA